MSRSHKDNEIAAFINALRDVAIEFHAAQQLRERIAGLVLDFLKPHPCQVGTNTGSGDHEKEISTN